MSSLDYNFGDSARAAFTHQPDDKTRHFGDVRERHISINVVGTWTYS